MEWNEYFQAKIIIVFEKFSLINNINVKRWYCIA